MHLRIDGARHDDEATGIKDFAGALMDIVANRNDFSVRDRDRSFRANKSVRLSWGRKNAFAAPEGKVGFCSLIHGANLSPDWTQDQRKKI